jgi:hypothetical protein
MAPSAAHFVVEKDDAVTPGREAVGAFQQELIPISGPGTVWIKPRDSRADHQGYPNLEEEEWSIGFLQIIESGGGSHSVDVIELIRTTPPIEDPDAVQPVPTEHSVRTKTLIDPADPFMHLFWGHDTEPPITFKSEVKITLAGAGTYFLALRLLGRTEMRRTF